MDGNSRQERNESGSSESDAEDMDETGPTAPLLPAHPGNGITRHRPRGRVQHRRGRKEKAIANEDTQPVRIVSEAPILWLESQPQSSNRGQPTSPSPSPPLNTQTQGLQTKMDFCLGKTTNFEAIQNVCKNIPKRRRNGQREIHVPLRRYHARSLRRTTDMAS